MSDLSDKVARSDTLDHIARAGLIAYGVVHLLIAWLAVQLALGDAGGRKADTGGALRELAAQPFGRLLVWAVAIGLIALVVWRLLEAAVGYRDEDGADRLRKRLAAAGKAVVYGVMGLTAVRIASGSGGGGGGGGEEGLTARLMSLPAGQVLVVVVGLAIIGVAGATAWRGWSERFVEDLDAEGRSGRSGRAVRTLGKAGHVAKGAALALVGGLFVYAGWTRRSRESGGLDDALREVLDQPFGPVLLILIAVGIAAYGVFALVRARYLDR